MLYPTSKLREESGLVDHNPDRKAPYLVFYPEDTAQSRQFITAICLNPEAIPEFKVLEGENYIGIRMQKQHSVEETYLNLRAINGSIHTSSGVQIGDWMTDAYLLHTSRPAIGNAAVERFFMSDGSYLRHGSRSEIESLTKLTACWSQGDTVDVVSSDVPPSVAIYAGRASARVRWNGRHVSTVFDRQKGLVALQWTS
jgi:hypothetical protein